MIIQHDVFGSSQQSERKDGDCGRDPAAAIGGNRFVRGDPCCFKNPLQGAGFFKAKSIIQKITVGRTDRALNVTWPAVVRANTVELLLRQGIQQAQLRIG